MQALVAEYSNSVDWMDWDRLRGLFWPDATLDFGEMFRGGVEGFIGFVTELEGGYSRRMHLLGPAFVSGTDGDYRAECVSITAARTAGRTSHRDECFYGRYIFALRTEGEDWRFSSLMYLVNDVQGVETENGDDGPVNVAESLDRHHRLAP